MSRVILVDGFEDYDLTLLVEGKALATVSGSDDVRDKLLSRQYDFNKGRFKSNRRSSKSFTRAFEAFSRRVASNLRSQADQYLAGKLPHRRWEGSIKGILREAYNEAYKFGVNSSGIRGTSAGWESTEYDRKYIQSAYLHEMRFLTRLVKQAKEGRVRGSLDKRLEAYADALKSIYYAGRVRGTPNDWIIDWIAAMDNATCNGCEFLHKHSPYTKHALPTQPRGGSCKCRCVTTPGSRVLTRRGLIPIIDVVVGDEVLTHRLRWRKVAATPRRGYDGRPLSDMVSPLGTVVGFTSDHPLLTDSGWVGVGSVLSLGLDVYSLSYELLDLWSNNTLGCGVGPLSSLSEGLPDLWWRKRPQGDGVHFMRYEAEGEGAVAGDGCKDESFYQELCEEETEEMGGFGRGELCLCEGRREKVHEVLGGRLLPLHLPVSLGLGEDKWPHSGGVRRTPHQWGLFGRPDRELGAVSLLRSAYGLSPGGVAEGGKVQESSGKGLWDVWEEIQIARQGGEPPEEVLLKGLCLHGVGKESSDFCCMQDLWEGFFPEALEGGEPPILHQGVLRPKTLYDLTVEDDHSFVVEGLVAHNSLCRCRLVMREVSHTRWLDVDSKNYSRRWYTRKLADLKSGRTLSA